MTDPHTDSVGDPFGFWRSPPKEWRRVALWDLADYSNGAAFKPTDASPNGRLVIKITELKFGLSAETKRFDGAVKDRQIIRDGDLLFAWSGNPETSLDAFWWRGEEAILNQHIFRVSPRGTIDKTYLYYLFKFLRPVFVRTARDKATSMGHVKVSDMKRLVAHIPPREEQEAIAHTLGTLDNKIELNRRMNKTLEAMARALFKSWFVDFDPVRAKAEGRKTGLPREIDALFPDSFEESEIGAVPKEWKVSRLGTMLTIDRGVSYKGEGLVDSGRPMINLGCFGGEGRFREDKVKGYDGEFKPRHLVRPGELVVANTDMTQQRVILGSPILIPEYVGECLFSHHVYGLRFNSGNANARLLVYYNLLEPSFREKAEGYATGTTVLFLPQDAILNSPIAVPPSPLLHVFNHQAEALRARAEASTMESATLVKARDTLLPKLISGELRVPPAKDMEATPEVVAAGGTIAPGRKSLDHQPAGVR